jgi:hypothetical protein
MSRTLFLSVDVETSGPCPAVADLLTLGAVPVLDDGTVLEQLQLYLRLDHGRLVASGSPLELTRGGAVATIRLVVTEPFPPGAPDSLTAALGPATEVTQLDAHSLLVTGPAAATTLGKVSRWCEEQGVVPESLTLGQRNLEDVFLELTREPLP